MTDFMKLAEEKRNAAERIEVLSFIYTEIEKGMHWNSMDYHDPDDTHNELWFSEPDKNDFNYIKYKTYKEVLETIEKMAQK